MKNINSYKKIITLILISLFVFTSCKLVDDDDDIEEKNSALDNTEISDNFDWNSTSETTFEVTWETIHNITFARPFIASIYYKDANGEFNNLIYKGASSDKGVFTTTLKIPNHITIIKLEIKGKEFLDSRIINKPNWEDPLLFNRGK